MKTPTLTELATIRPSYQPYIKDALAIVGGETHGRPSAEQKWAQGVVDARARCLSLSKQAPSVAARAVEQLDLAICADRFGVYEKDLEHRRSVLNGMLNTRPSLSGLPVGTIYAAAMALQSKIEGDDSKERTQRSKAKAYMLDMLTRRGVQAATVQRREREDLVARLLLTPIEGRSIKQALRMLKDADEDLAGLLGFEAPSREDRATRVLTRVLASTPNGYYEVSHGTCNIDHVLPRLVELANKLGLDATNRYGDVETYVELLDTLDQCAPDGYYFGSNDGDGSAIGYWPIEETIEETN